MLEIWFVRWLFNSLSTKAKAKGQPGSWGGLGVAFWFGGEIMGTVVGLMLTTQIACQPQQNFARYVCGNDFSRLAGQA